MLNDIAAESFERRLRNVERRAKIFYGAGLLCFLASIVVVSARPASSRGQTIYTVQTPFLIKDAQGRLIFEVKSSNGMGRLNLYDGKNPYLSASVGEKSHGLYLRQLHDDKNNKESAISLNAWPEGGFLIVKDAKGKTSFKRP